MVRKILALLLSFGFAGSTQAQDADPKVLSKTLEAALEAYNKDDVKTFFKEWAKSVESITTEPTYNALYKQGAKSQVGNYKPKSLKLIKEGTALTGDFLIVYFDAEFDKEKKGKISVNFQKEGNAYKLMQLQISKKE
jgi:hypothetical protein